MGINILKDYAQGFDKALLNEDAEAKFQPNIVESADSKIAIAQVNDERRAKADAIKQKISNLKAQKAQLQERLQMLGDVTDDEIYRMGKIAGIKDDDLNGYISARTGQRNYDITKKSIEAQNKSAEAAKAEESNKAAEISNKLVADLTTKLEDIEKNISILNVDIAEGNKEGVAKAEAEKKFLESQYEKAKEEYKKLSKNNWNGSPVDYKPKAKNGLESAEESNVDTNGWTNTEKAKYSAANADEKNLIAAGKEDEKEKKANAEKNFSEKVARIKNAVKSASTFNEARMKAVELYQYLTSNKKQSDNISKILTDSGWNVKKKEKVGK